METNILRTYGNIIYQWGIFHIVAFDCHFWSPDGNFYRMITSVTLDVWKSMLFTQKYNTPNLHGSLPLMFSSKLLQLHFFGVYRILCLRTNRFQVVLNVIKITLKLLWLVYPLVNVIFTPVKCRCTCRRLSPDSHWQCLITIVIPINHPGPPPPSTPPKKNGICWLTPHTTKWCGTSNRKNGAPWLAKLVPITPVPLGSMVHIPVVNGSYEPTCNWGHHLVWICVRMLATKKARPEQTWGYEAASSGGTTTWSPATFEPTGRPKQSDRPQTPAMKETKNGQFSCRWPSYKTDMVKMRYNMVQHLWKKNWKWLAQQ